MLENSTSATSLQIVFVAVTTIWWPRLHALPSFPRAISSTQFLQFSLAHRWLKPNLRPLHLSENNVFCTNIIVVMTIKASQWDSFHVELAMECHGGKKIVTSCRVTCWLYHAAAGNSRGHFNIVEGCNAFHVVTLHVTSTSAPKALTLSLSRVSLAHCTS